MNDIGKYSDWVESMWFSGKDRPAEEAITIATLGLTGEVGEVMELMKKRLRDGTFDKENLKKELGDVLYYWCKLGRYFELSPSEIISANIEKLESRKIRNKMRGSGDNR